MATRPTPQDARQALLDLFREYGIRSGHALPVGPIQVRLVGFKEGQFDVEELVAGVKLMIAQGEIEEKEDGGQFLTDAGYAAI